MQGEGDSFDSGQSEDKEAKRKNQIITDQWILWLVVALVVIAIMVIGAVAYHQNKVVEYGNCAAVGGQLVEYRNEYKCIKMEG